MKRLIAAIALSAFVGACQTATVGLLPDEKGVVGKVAVLDKKTGAERGELTSADTEAKTGGRKVKAKSSKGRFASLFGSLPRPVVVSELNFVSGTTTVTDQSREELVRLLDLWKTERKISDIQIIGYADSTGKTEDNLKLSEDRARAVKDLLANEGFEFTDDNSEVVGRGDIEALAKNGPNVPDESFRRVTIVVR